MIRNDLLNTNWESLFTGWNSSETSLVFTDTMLHFFSEHLSNKIITLDAPWITPHVKTAIRRNSRVYRKRVKRGRNANDHGNVREIRISLFVKISGLILKNYVIDCLILKQVEIISGQRWNELQIKRSLQTSHSFFTTISSKKPIFSTITDQCKLLDNGSALPGFISKMSWSLSKLITITIDQIVEITQRYNSKKAHGCDEISVAPVMCLRGCIPLSLIFRKCVTSGTFPNSWENSNVQPVYKK